MVAYKCIAILVVAPYVIESIDELMVVVTETMLLAPIISVEPTIDVIDNSVVN